MALTADHLIVIGRGRLIADATTADFIAQATRSSVRVRSPRLADLRAALIQANLQVSDLDGALEVVDAPIERVGDVAGEAGITLHELTPQVGSLEEAFMQLTGDAVEYGGSDVRPDTASFTTVGSPAGFPTGAMPPDGWQGAARFAGRATAPGSPGGRAADGGPR